MAWILGLSAATGAILGLGFTHALLMAISSMVLALVVAIWAIESAYPHLILVLLVSITVHQMAYLAFGLFRETWMPAADGAGGRKHGSEVCEWTESGNASNQRANP